VIQLKIQNEKLKNGRVSAVHFEFYIFNF